MASVLPLPAEVRPERRGLSFWMDRVRKELRQVRESPGPDAVHDLRVAIRRCRSLAAAMEEIDPHPAWPAMRKTARKLFRGLGALRDVHVLQDWVKKLTQDGDPIRAQLLAQLEAAEKKHGAAAIRLASRFNEKKWLRLAQSLRRRARLVPPGSVAASGLALERFEEARELHSRALRTEKAKPWHALRIGLKRFRYTVESLLPEQHAAWCENLKQVQDVLGDIHDLDVLAGLAQDSPSLPLSDSQQNLLVTIARERAARIETYRQLTLGTAGLWSLWRLGLPANGNVAAAADARLKATARAAAAHPEKARVVARISADLFRELRRLRAAPFFPDAATRRIFRAATQLHDFAVPGARRSPQKAARKFLAALPVPPGWTNPEWNLLPLIIRYHRGALPKQDHGAFSKLSSDEQPVVAACSGILRMARALRKAGAVSTKDYRIEKTAQGFVLQIPALQLAENIVARLNAAARLLQFGLRQPVSVKPAQPQTIVLALPNRGVASSVKTSAAAAPDLAPVEK